MIEVWLGLGWNEMENFEKEKQAEKKKNFVKAHSLTHSIQLQLLKNKQFKKFSRKDEKNTFWIE